MSIKVKSLNITTTNGTTNLDASFISDLNVPVESIGVAVRNSAGSNQDFAPLSNINMTANTVLPLKVSKTFTPGTYSYFAFCKVYGTWYTISDTKTFTVSANSPVVTGDPAGWKQVWREDFDKDAAAGSFRSVYPSFGDYGDDSPATNGAGTYNNAVNVSAANSLCKIKLQYVNGKPSGAVLVANNWAAQTYGRYSIRYRVVPGPGGINGYGSAFLLWPASDNWAEGEVDFPESPFTDSQYMATFHKPGASLGTTAYKNLTTASWYDWHVATIEWLPGSLKFFIDDKLVGSTSTAVPSTPFKWIVQTSVATGGNPKPENGGELQIDWMTYYSKV